MNWEILYKYVQDKCDEEELHQLGVWLQEDRANEDLFKSFIEGWHENHENEENKVDTDVRAAWNEFMKRNAVSGIEVEEPLNSLDSTLKRNHIFERRQKQKGVYWSYIAAAVMVLVVALIFIIRHPDALRSSTQEKELRHQEITTVKGQRSNLKLSDGTKIILNSSSSLRIPQNYGDGNRILYLEGEAFFEVEHDEENPFIVISDGVYTKDLGTQFNITAYDTGTVEVAVKEGLVSMGKMDNKKFQKEIVELTPNKLGVLKESDGLTVSNIENMDKHVGWTEGKLVFQNTPFREVVRRLEHWFDIECSVESSSESLNKRTLTATYENMPMSEVLKVMAISMDVSYSRQERTIVFKDEKMDLEKLKQEQFN